MFKFLLFLTLTLSSLSAFSEAPMLSLTYACKTDRAASNYRYLSFKIWINSHYDLKLNQTHYITVGNLSYEPSFANEGEFKAVFTKTGRRNSGKYNFETGITRGAIIPDPLYNTQSVEWYKGYKNESRFDFHFETTASSSGILTIGSDEGAWMIKYECRVWHSSGEHREPVGNDWEGYSG